MKLLELRFSAIEENSKCFKVSVEGSPGEFESQVTLPFLDGENSDSDMRFTIVKVLESIKFNQDSFNEAEQTWLVREKILSEDNFEANYLKSIGCRLYEVLGEKIQHLIESALADAKRDRTWLHIRLRFPANVTKYNRLTDYPWELLYKDDGFLAEEGVIFSRYIAYQSPCPNLPKVEQLNILLISSGAGDERMGLKPLPSNEREAIGLGLQKAQNEGKIKLERLEPPTFKALQRRLLQRGNPHILHFDGHGFWGKRCNQAGCRKAYKANATKCECGANLGESQGYLVFEKDNGSADYVSAKELGQLLGNSQLREQPNSEPGITLVVLSACRSGMSFSGKSVFNGVGQKLIGQGIPAVVAMQYSISVSAAGDFAEYFYRSLGEENPLAIALKSGQGAIGIEGNEWYRPILYLRWQDNHGGQLFSDIKEEVSLSANTDFDTPQISFKKLSIAEQLKKKNLEKRLAKLTLDIEELERDYNDAGDGDDKNRFQSKLERKYEQLNQIENDLNQLNYGE